VLVLIASPTVHQCDVGERGPEPRAAQKRRARGVRAGGRHRGDGGEGGRGGRLRGGLS
jgi:hypothetical protein